MIFNKVEIIGGYTKFIQGILKEVHFKDYKINIGYYDDDVLGRCVGILEVFSGSWRRKEFILRLIVKPEIDNSKIRFIAEISEREELTVMIKKVLNHIEMLLEEKIEINSNLSQSELVRGGSRIEEKFK